MKNENDLWLLVPLLMAVIALWLCARAESQGYVPPIRPVVITPVVQTVPTPIRPVVFVTQWASCGEPSACTTASQSGFSPAAPGPFRPAPAPSAPRTRYEDAATEVDRSFYRPPPAGRSYEKVRAEFLTRAEFEAANDGGKRPYFTLSSNR